MKRGVLFVIGLFLVLSISGFVYADNSMNLKYEGITYTVKLLSASDTSAIIIVNDSEGNSKTKELSPEQIVLPFNVKEVGGLEIVLISADEIVPTSELKSTLLVGLRINLYMNGTSTNYIKNFSIDGKDYTIELVSADDFSATIKVNGTTKNIDPEQTGLAVTNIKLSNKIEGIQYILRDADESIPLNSLNVTLSAFYEKNFSIGTECAGQGEQTFDWDTPITEYKGCCEGLDNVLSTDSISVADKCYWTGTESGVPFEICSNCGNGICENVEGVCGCPEDCAGKGLSNYKTNQDFCQSDDYDASCKDLPEGMELELCNLCSDTPNKCVNECNLSGKKMCDGNNSYKTCGNYDTDNCLEYGNKTLCSYGDYCSGGECISKSIPPTLECKPIGLRENSKYCSSNNKWIIQKSDEKSCENDFECKTNICLNSKCGESPSPNNKIYWIIGIVGVIVIIVILLIILLKPKKQY